MLHIMVPLSTAERHSTSGDETFHRARHSTETMRRVICDLDSTVAQTKALLSTFPGQGAGERTTATTRVP
jgi:hypothetical protein